MRVAPSSGPASSQSQRRRHALAAVALGTLFAVPSQAQTTQRIPVSEIKPLLALAAERGERLAGRLGAESVLLAELPQRLADFDIVVSCTASSLPIIGLGAVRSALKARRHRPIFMVDLAVPRDIEPEVANMDDVYLYGVMNFVFIRSALQLHANSGVRDRKLPTLRTYAEKYIKMMPDLVRQDGLGWAFGRAAGATARW